ncbi:MAG TPA: RNA 2',3'-cyclic phosphodiesterase [Nitrospiraceae bacterium]|nr:RNA 2',3'-cyclic phosphodiesterase [Nitrospiraceae bacterium]
MIRAFLAVELSQDLRAGITTIQQELKRKIETGMTRNTRISWVQPTSIHLTIKFLGDMDEQALDPLLVAVEHAIGNQAAMNVPLDRLGAFPRPHSPRVLWVGPPENWEQGKDAKGIGEIHGAIEAACEGLGFLRETRPFSLHLTLARIRMGERHVGLVLTQSGVLDRPISAGSLAVESVAMMRSELKPTGSVHTKLWEVRLQG